MDNVQQRNGLILSSAALLLLLSRNKKFVDASREYRKCVLVLLLAIRKIGMYWKTLFKLLEHPPQLLLLSRNINVNVNFSNFKFSRLHGSSTSLFSPFALRWRYWCHKCQCMWGAVFLEKIGCQAKHELAWLMWRARAFYVMVPKRSTKFQNHLLYCPPSSRMTSSHAFAFLISLSKRKLNELFNGKEIGIIDKEIEVSRLSLLYQTDVFSSSPKLWVQRSAAIGQ